MTPEAFDALHRNKLALCLNDDFFEPDRYQQTADLVYFRFHKDVYGPGDVRRRADRCATYTSDVYAIFQHEDSPDSVKPALEFLGYVTS
jgi:hypothetical protein